MIFHVVVGLATLTASVLASFSASPVPKEKEQVKVDEQAKLKASDEALRDQECLQCYETVMEEFIAACMAPGRALDDPDYPVEFSTGLEHGMVPPWVKGQFIDGLQRCCRISPTAAARQLQLSDRTLYSQNRDLKTLELVIDYVDEYIEDKYRRLMFDGGDLSEEKVALLAYQATLERCDVFWAVGLNPHVPLDDQFNNPEEDSDDSESSSDDSGRPKRRVVVFRMHARLLAMLREDIAGLRSNDDFANFWHHCQSLQNLSEPPLDLNTISSVLSRYQSALSPNLANLVVDASEVYDTVEKADELPRHLLTDVIRVLPFQLALVALLTDHVGGGTQGGRRFDAIDASSASEAQFKEWSTEWARLSAEWKACIYGNDDDDDEKHNEASSNEKDEAKKALKRRLKRILIAIQPVGTKLGVYMTVHKVALPEESFFVSTSSTSSASSSSTASTSTNSDAPSS